jgi:hypothetical protein
LSFPEPRGECHFERKPHFLRAQQGATDIPILGIGIERDQFVAMLAVRLKPVADIPRSLSEKLRAFGAFDFYFIFGHEMALQEKWQSPGQILRDY